MTEVEELRSKLAEAERERDEAQDAIRREVTAANLQFFSRKTDELGAALLKAAAERDAVLSELAKLRAEAEWRPIEMVPTGKLAYQQIICGHAEKKWIRFGRRLPGQNDWYYSGTNERSQWAEQTGDAPTHFRPLPSPPKDPAHD